MRNKTTNSIVPGARCALLAVQFAALLSLSACGGSDSPAEKTGAAATNTSNNAAAHPTPEEPDNRGLQPASMVNALSFEATGDSEAVLESDGSDLLLTGGCLDQNVLGMSFTRGQITDKDLFQVRLRTAESVGAGETGTFEVSELGWYDGQFKPENLPTEANILVPDAYEGSGKLMLTLHEPGGLNGRMAGTVEGTVTQVGGDNEAVVKASFDINIGCTNLPLY